MSVSDFLQWASNGATAIAAVFTAFGAWAAVKQLRLLENQNVTSFEDRLVDYYRDITKDLPLEALLGAEIDEQQLRTSLPAFYRYFDLCNQQAFLHKQGRITPSTWVLWKDGIQSNLKRPAFALAWAEIAARAHGDFDELRALCPPREAARAAALKEAA